MTAPAPCTVLPAALVASYCDGSLDGAAAWSVEAHLPGCPACRAVLSGRVDSRRLRASRAVVLARAGLPRPGRAGRALRRCGVPDHITALLAATPSLRRSWLAGIVLVLAVVIAATRLAATISTGTLAPGVLHAGAATSASLLAGSSGWYGLLPFFVLAPLLPLAAVAAAFSPALDPAHRLSAAAPVSAITLLCVRSAAVTAASLLPAALAALALPGPWWLAVTMLLPALAICAAALALATVIRPLPAAAAVAAGWAALVLAAAHAAHSSWAAFSPAGQAGAGAVLLAGVALIAARRYRFDYLREG